MLRKSCVGKADGNEPIGARTSLATKKRTAAKTINLNAHVKGRAAAIARAQRISAGGGGRGEGALHQQAHLIILNGGMSAQKMRKAIRTRSVRGEKVIGM